MPKEDTMNIKVKLTPANKMARAAFDAAACSAAARSEAMTKWMEEVTSLLCFQPEVPLKHKEDLCAALNSYKQVLHAIEITEPQNAGTQRPGSPDGLLATETRKPGSLK